MLNSEHEFFFIMFQRTGLQAIKLWAEKLISHEYDMTNPKGVDNCKKKYMRIDMSEFARLRN